MFVIVGFVIVFISVFGGFVLEGGHLQVLIQPVELLIIGGAGAGALIAASSGEHLREIRRMVMATLRPSPITQDMYLEWMKLLFELMKTAKANPLGLEPHIDRPESSEIFRKYPGALRNHHAVHFLCDTLKVQISASMNPYDLEELMDGDIAAVHEEESRVPGTVNRIGDAMPGLGIVAAVLGVVITMGKLAQGKDVIGHSVAAALVGTFIGILLSYGFMQPLAAKIQLNLDEEGKVFSVIKACLLAYAKDCSPKICVEFARRTIPPSVRPGFEEVDRATSSATARAA